MLPISRALRPSLRAGLKAPSATIPVARTYATVSEEVGELAPDALTRKVDMSNIEKGKGYYINYKRIEDNLKIVRSR